ncbi:MAG: hypothetical protein L3J36_02255 [Rhodobacteraceae bacterium]|nr:hypothetical protein [Paracoccaceae bacterium]
MPPMAWEEIKVTYRKLQPQLKPLDLAKADKQIKLTKAALQKAWDAEDKFIEAFEAAKKNGLKGKKPKDFMGDPGFKKAHAALTKMAGEHATIVKALLADSEVAKKLDKPLIKLLGDIKKGITKGDKAQAKFQKEVQEAEAAAKKIATAIGKLTAPELFYGPQVARVIDKIINKSKDSGISGDADKLIEEKERKKNVNAAGKLAAKAAKFCKDAYLKAEVDPKAAEPLLKKAAKQIKKLEAINKPYQNVKKKSADLIKKSKDKAKISKAIDAIAGYYDDSARTLKEVTAEVKSMAG